MALISARDLALGYDAQIIMQGINFTIKEGEYLCIVGENGSGKSTLLKTLLGLIQPMGGSIEFGDGLKKNEIGYLPQQTPIQRDFPASVTEIVLSGCQGHCDHGFFYGKKNRESAKRNMERMGISDLADKCYRELSGGQQQRVLLSRALCAAERILLLDEPVSGLDPVVTQRMYELISKLNRDGIAVIMISHDVASAIRYADHILHIGDTFFFGTTQEYMESKEGRAFILQSGDDAALTENEGRAR